MKTWAGTLALGLLVVEAGRAYEPLGPEEVSPVCSRSPRFWAVPEYLLWWTKDDRPPGPLVTTGPAGDPRQGVVGNPTTGMLFDGSRLDYRQQSGARLTFGYWLDDEQTCALEVAGFVLETHTIHGEANSNRTDGAPVIARPFFNVLTGQEDAQVITSPQDSLGGRYLGGIDVFADSRLWGGEANLVRHLGSGPCGSWDVLAGFRYLGQKDELRFSLSSTVLIPGTVGFGGAAALPPNIVSWRDFFETNNHFYGGQIGLRGRYDCGPWSLDLAGKVGLGDTVQKVSLSGHTLHTDSTGKTLSEPGGLYALPSNLGDRTRDTLTFITEATVQVGCQFTPRLRTLVGYTFLYWDDVARPGYQINRNLDPRQIASHRAFTPVAAATQPVLTFQSTDFWAQGLTVGLEFRY